MNTEEIPDTHRQLIIDLFKGGEKVLPELTVSDANLLHAAIGITTEAGELQKAVLLAIRARQDNPNPKLEANNDLAGLDIENMKEELGDHLFYEGALRIHAGMEDLYTDEEFEDDAFEEYPSLWPHANAPVVESTSGGRTRMGVLSTLVSMHVAYAADIADVVKKTVFYRKKLNALTLRKLLIDDSWVTREIAALTRLCEHDIREANVAKLRTRYKDGYTDRAAQDRADKKGEE